MENDFQKKENYIKTIIHCLIFSPNLFKREINGKT